MKYARRPYYPKKTDYSLDMKLLLTGLVLATIAVAFFHFKVIVPYLDSIIPTVQATTNEEACELLEEGYYKNSDVLAEAYCYGN